MTDDTMESRKISSPGWNDKGVKLREFKANGTDIKACMIVTTEGETVRDIDLCADGERGKGIVWTRYDTDKDTAYADDDDHVPVAVFEENRGLGVWAYTSVDVAVTEEDLYLGNAGLADKWVDGTDSFVDAVLQGAEEQDADASDIKLRKFTVI